MDRSGADQKMDFDILEGLSLELLRKMKKYDRKGRGPYADGAKREDVIALRDSLLLQLERFKTRADADLAATLHTEMQDLIEKYSELKQRAGKLDFVDLLFKVREMLRNNQDVRAFLQHRFRF